MLPRVTPLFNRKAFYYSAVAGAGTGSVPWAHFTNPLPSSTGRNMNGVYTKLVVTYGGSHMSMMESLHLLHGNVLHQREIHALWLRFGHNSEDLHLRNLVSSSSDEPLIILINVGQGCEHVHVGLAYSHWLPLIPCLCSGSAINSSPLHQFLKFPYKVIPVNTRSIHSSQVHISAYPEKQS